MHKPGKGNVAADALSRRPDLLVEDHKDNLDQIVLPNCLFKLAATTSHWVGMVSDCDFKLAATQGWVNVMPDQDLLERIRNCISKDQEVAAAIGLKG